jgi:anti-sigma regulatory factor (Ser/Thr protein kinase)
MDDIAILTLRREMHEPGDARLRTREFAAEPHAPRAARRFALDSAGPLGDSARQVLELVVSELATNAVVHAGTAFTVSLQRDPASLRVEVTDSGSGDVTVHNPDVSDTHGRGLTIVRALADDWGVRPGPAGGKTVWFVLDITGNRRTARPAQETEVRV